MIPSVFTKSASSWSALLERLPALINSGWHGAVTIAFLADGKKLFAFGYDVGVSMARYESKKNKFIEEGGDHDDLWEK